MILVRSLALRGTGKTLAPSTVHVEASETMVKGEYVSFVMKRGEITVDPPKDFVMIQDIDGKTYRKCDFYVVQYRFLQNDIGYFSPGLVQQARKYYGEHARFEQGIVALPTRSWQSFGRVEAIRYRRRGDKADDFEHVFDSSESALLSKSLSPLGLRVRLPTHCVADERGFVVP